MDRPHKTALKLYDIGCMQGIEAKYVQTGTDTAETMISIKGSCGSVGGKWSTYKEFLDVYVGHNYVARLKPQYSVQVERWRRFERENAAELAEYERLRAKFDGGA